VNERGSVLLEAMVAMMIFMMGSVAVVLLFNHSLGVLTEVELEGRIVPEVAAIAAGEMDEGEREVETGTLRWEWDDRLLVVEFVREGEEEPRHRWELGR
jgi:hypothetical protein